MIEERLVVEIQRRRKLVAGEPFFLPGVPISIDRHGLGDAGPGDLAVVRTGRGRARVERVLGPADRIEVVLEGLMHQRGEIAEYEPHDVPAQSLEGRVDLRELPTLTIDPETAKDFDDAISMQRDGAGVRAFVHIADVAHFVPAGTPLDRGAAERGFSVYVPGRVSPMLPQDLADDVCSLRPGEDRLTVTAEMPLDAGRPSGEPTFYRSVIRSRARLTYAEAQEILAGGRSADADVAETLGLADDSADELRRRRFARGALRIEAPEAVFSFDGDGGIERASLEAEPRAHALVEELMILANEAVAGFLATRRSEALYRVHEPPEPQSIARLVSALADLDVPTGPVPDLDALSAQAAARLAGEISDRVTDYVQKVGRGATAFPALVLRALKQARYDPRNLGHAGLASPAYCHFTSPIRRYPDIVCHRALLRELGVADDPPAEDLGFLAEHTSAREREAADVEYAADAICLAWLLEQTLFAEGWEQDFTGEITGLIGSGLFVRFGEVFEGYLPVRVLRDDFYELNTLGTALQGRRGGRTFRLGDAINVRVKDVRRAEGKVELALAAAGRS